MLKGEMLRPGSLVTPNLRLVRPLGQGGMGRVWVADHLGLGAQVALKLIAEEHADKERSLVRFRREASSAAKLKSPHVVKVFDHGVTEEGVPFIAMELLEGETLGDRLARLERLSLRETRLLVGQVAQALTEAHEIGIVHRDLKPDNLFLVRAGYELFVKVLDFGIAKNTGEPVAELTETGAMVGTPHYMSPEMVKGNKDIDGRADLWALAVVAYRALTGRLPFDGDTLGAIAIAINEASFAPPSSLVAGLSPDIDAWFKLALCRSLAARFATATELADAFREATAAAAEDELPELPLRPSAPESPGDRASTLGGAADSSRAARDGRRRWPVAMALALVAAGAAALSIGGSEPTPEPASSPPDGSGTALAALPSSEPTSEPAVDPEPPAAPPEAAPSETAAPAAMPRRVLPRPTAAASTGSDRCRQPFTINDQGDYVPKPECFAR